LGTRGRGFGLMPALDLSRAARNAIEVIEKRLPRASVQESK
jgi:hypothetical protein